MSVTNKSYTYDEDENISWYACTLILYLFCPEKQYG